MYQDNEVGAKLEKNKFENSISELKKKTFVSIADIESYGDCSVTPEYQEAYRRSIDDPEGFWGEVAQELEWTKPWERVLDNSNPPFTKWWVGGEMSVCYNAVDRHVANGRGDQVALVHDSPLTDTVRKITYSEIKDQVCFAARELRTRIEHAEPTVIIAASCGVEPNKIVRYKDILDEALCQSDFQPNNCIIFQRRRVLECTLEPGRDINWEDALEADPVPCVPVEANEPLYILYTSGTTSAPKGIQRPCGHAAVLCWSLRTVYGLKKGVWWAASDLGWVVGHSYICYGPLLAGVTSVLYEGKPDRTPDPGQYFRIIEQHRVNALFTIPTAFRVLKRADPNAKYARRYCSKSLKTQWSERIFGVPVLNHWWQTESGSPITAPCMGYNVKAIPPHSAGYPVPGYDNAGWISAEGAVWVVARADDVINVAGHRLSTAALEDVVLRHARVADAVVVGAPDPTKGDVPLCLYVMRPPQDDEEIVAESTVTQELIALVRHLIGPIAAFRKAVAVPALPRTRSGKALRGAIAKLARSQLVKLPSTIEDPSVFGEIKIALQKFGYAIDAPDPEM
ncbi:hypothetical protein HF086_006043 [Spodoptera exigua]|uniref:Acyl-CoA synthetase short-chain family member 3, mitochondrial n=1 Tax=Spodoptera exigua TaxID=7107 RepID=A0A922SNS3_SPOEX|nr:hypothetical protein HF086_006043 [Spodoptera exigua]